MMTVRRGVRLTLPGVFLASPPEARLTPEEEAGVSCGLRLEAPGAHQAGYKAEAERRLFSSKT
jgi:hypothetical protein